MKDQKNIRKVRTFLIYPRFQLKLIALNSFLFLSCLAICGVAIHFTFEMYVNDGLSVGANIDHPFFRYLEIQKLQMVKYLCFAGTVVLLVSLSFNLWLSHKISGPIVRLNSFLISAESKKELESFDFRNGDFFRELPENLKIFLEKADSSEAEETDRKAS